MKKALSIAVALIMVVALAACSSGGGSSASGDSLSAGGDSSASTGGAAPSGDVEVTLKLAHGHAAQSVVGMQYQVFADTVAELSGGTMAIEQHVGGSLLTDPETLDGVIDGTVDIAHVMSSFASGTVKDIAPLEVYGFYSGDDWQGFLAETRPVVEKVFEPFGVKFLGSTYQGEIAFICAEKQIKTPADMQGMTFRSAGTWYGKCIEAFGAAPTAIGLADMTTAFERGTVQGTVVGWNVIVPLALHETANYISSTDTQTYYTCMLMNSDSWDGLTAEQQAIIEEASKVFEEEAEVIGREMIDQYIKTAEDNGNEIYYLTEAEQKVFLDLVQPIYDEMTDLTENGQELVRIIKENQGNG